MQTATLPADAPDQIDAAATLRSALDDVMEAVETLGAAVRHVEDLDVADSVALLKDLRSVICDLRGFDAGFFTRHLAELLRFVDGPVEVDGVAAIEITRSKTRRAWQHAQLSRDWLTAYMISLGGEVPDPAELLAALFQSASVSGWKVGGLKALGLDVDDYCDSTPGTPNVRFL